MELSLAEVHEAIAAVKKDAECLVHRDRRLSWNDVTERTRRLANALVSRDMGCHTERAELAGHESGQDHLGLYLHNGVEYLEGMLGAFKARVAPFNVNYRYVEEELAYLLNDSQATGLIFHSAFAPTLAAVLDKARPMKALFQVPDGSGNDLLPGAEWYEDVLAAASPEPPAVTPSPDDLYILYTGGTTGMPKGVLWRQADIFAAALGGAPVADTDAYVDVESWAATLELGAMRALPAAPFMHGAGHWIAFMAFHGGGTVVVQGDTARLDPSDVWSTVVAEKIQLLLIVGDAYGRPLLDELAANTYDLSGLSAMISGGAALSPNLKEEFLSHASHLLLIDGLGSSEAGGQGQQISTAAGGASTGSFAPSPGSCVLAEDLSSVLEPGHDGQGWLAKGGRIPLGYLGDPEKTARTFVTVGDARYSIPGDRARLRTDGVFELLGRDSVTINSGGEKIFAEEVEMAIKAHDGVYDCVVAGRPSERWGNEVVAIVRLKDGHEVSEADLTAEAERHIARYKCPKAYVFVDEIVRSPAGKADYRWAKGIVAADG